MLPPCGGRGTPSSWWGTASTIPSPLRADAGIAISDGAAIAREIADITIAADSLWELVRLRQLAMALLHRIQNNYRFVIGFNGALIGLGVAGVLPPATSAMLHNLSTLGVSLHSMSALPISNPINGLDHEARCVSTGLFLVFPLANAPDSRGKMALYRAVIRRLLYGRENHCHSGKIQEAALAEFLDKGFQGTSLR